MQVYNQIFFTDLESVASQDMNQKTRKSNFERFTFSYTVLVLKTSLQKLSTLKHLRRRWEMRYNISQKPFNKVKSVINNPLKDFPQVECLCKEHKDCTEINYGQWKTFLQSFLLLQERVQKELKDLNCSTLSTSNVSHEWKSRSCLHDHSSLFSS